MSKVPVTARNLTWRKLTDGSLEADYGPGYREGEGTQQHPSHPNPVVSLKLGVDTIYWYASDLAAGRTGVQVASVLLQAWSRETGRCQFSCADFLHWEIQDKRKTLITESHDCGHAWGCRNLGFYCGEMIASKDSCELR